MRAPKKILGAIAGISMLATTLGIGSAAFAASPNYYDIYDLTTLAVTAINALGSSGVMTGTAPGKFDPSGIVTRAQAVKFAVNLANLNLVYPRTADFTDVTTAGVYYAYIETAMKDGLLNGMSSATSGGKFNPSTPITRADLAVLLTNALGDQALAQSMATDTTTYAHFSDLSAVPSGDLGDVNAMMKLGVVPPFNSSKIAPNGKVDREQMAVGLFRGMKQLEAAAPATATLTVASASTSVNTADALTVVAKDANGNAIKSLSNYTVAYSVTGANASSATVTSDGTFSASASGSYTVQASISGGTLTAPVTATTSVVVYGAPTALKVNLGTATVVADGNATDTVTVDVVDANGNVVGNYNGAVTLSDTSNGTSIIVNGSDPATATENAVNGVATFTVESTSGASGLSDTLTATASNNGTALTSGTATVTTAAQVATSVGLSFTSSSLEANTTSGSTVLDVEVLDQAGNPMLTGAYGVSLAISGPATFGGAATAATTFVGNGSLTSPNPATVTVNDIVGDTGTITVTGISGTLKSATATLKAVIAGAPSAFTITDSSPTFAEGSAGTTATVQAVDASGNPVADSDNNVVINATSGGAQATNIKVTSSGTTQTVGSSGGVTVGLNSNGEASITLSDTNSGAHAGSYTVTAAPISGAANNLKSASLTVTETAGSAAAIHVATSATQVPETAPSATVTAQVVDAYGNDVSTAGTAVTFTASGSGTINGTSSNSGTSSTNSSGVATATLTLPATATDNSFVTASASGLASGISSPVTVESAVTANVGLSLKNLSNNGDQNSTSAAIAGDDVQGTFSLTSSTGAAITTTDELQITVSPAGALSAPGLTSTGTSGVYTLNATNGSTTTFTAVESGVATITVKDLSVAAQPSAVATLDITAGTTVSGYDFFYNGSLVNSSNPLVVSSSQANSAIAITVSPVDGQNNPIASKGDVYINPSASPSTNVTFRATTGGADLSNANPLEIPGGASSVTLYILAPQGSYTLTAASVGTSPDATATTVTAASSTVAPGGSITIAVHLLDANGQAVTLPTTDEVGVKAISGTSLLFGGTSVVPATYQSTGTYAGEYTAAFTAQSGTTAGSVQFQAFTEQTSNSNVVTTFTTEPTVAITNLGQPGTVSVHDSSTGMSVSWVAATGAASYTVYRSTSAEISSSNLSSATKLQSGITGLSFLDTTANSPGTTYYYAVTATDSAGNVSNPTADSSGATGTVYGTSVASVQGLGATTLKVTFGSLESSQTPNASAFRVNGTSATGATVSGSAVQLTFPSGTLAAGDTISISQGAVVDTNGAPNEAYTSTLPASTAYEVGISPSSASITSGSGTQTFTITLEDQYGNSMTSGTDATDMVKVTLTAGSTADGGTLTEGTTTTAADTSAAVNVTVTLSGGTGTVKYTAPSTLPTGGSGTLTLADTTNTAVIQGNSATVSD